MLQRAWATLCNRAEGRVQKMPAKSERQRKMMGADLARARAGKKTKTGMSEKELEEFASKPRKGKKKS